MEQVGFLGDLIIIFSWSVVVVYFFDRIKIPSMVGFLVSGVALGPHGLSLIRDIRTVEQLAEIGVVLLLFTVGLEFSMTKLFRMRDVALKAGAAQVLLTVCVTAVIGWLITGKTGPSIFVGFLVALSSTAVVLKVLSNRAEINSVHGQWIVGLLIFQDICAVPMMLVTPMLAGRGPAGIGVLFLLLKAALLLLLVVAAMEIAVPRILFHTVNTRNRELFIMVVLLLCLGTAWITFETGLSLALGAFLAGMMIADSEYSHQVIAEILPFRDIFNSLFFVSVGMLLDTRYVLENIPLVVAATLGIFLIKAPSAAVPFFAFKYPARLAVITGISLSQIGEFSFVLAGVGLKSGMELGGLYQLFLASSVITMAATPFMIALAPKAANGILRHFSRVRTDRALEDGEKYPPIRDHVVIVGYGLNGRRLAKVLKATGIPYNILEMNPAAVRDGIKSDEPIHFGDATREHVLTHVSLPLARVLAVGASDPTVERRIVSVARGINPNLHIIVRTRYVREIEPLTALGANEVIPEEFETSIEIFAHVLQTYDVPYNVIMDEVGKARHQHYGMLRGVPTGRAESAFSAALLNELGMQTIEVPAGGAADGNTINGLNIRAETGATVLAVQRRSEFFANPQADFKLAGGDVAYIVGNPEQLKEAGRLIKKSRRTKTN
ncbi:MAG: cation:proton antiporter [Nitrospinae bacterium]|nr:cation:proton antiporter [Nitrospinota bacterium]